MDDVTVVQTKGREPASENSASSERDAEAVKSSVRKQEREWSRKPGSDLSITTEKNLQPSSSCTRCTYLVALALQRLQLPHTSLFLHRSTTPVIVIQRQPLFDWAFGLFLTLSPHGQTSVTLHWGCSASVYTINTAAVNPHWQPSSLSRLNSGHTGRIWLLVLESLAAIVTGAEGFSSTLFRLV